MEIAFHLKRFRQIRNDKNFFEHIKVFYSKEIETVYKDYHTFFQYQGRIYIGNEFCPHLLPSPDKLKRDRLKILEDKNIKLTLLTPPLTDKGLKQCCNLLDCLVKFKDSEVVVNDWGLLLFIKKRFPDLNVSVGRLLNKAFKDPRLCKKINDKTFTASTFNSPYFSKIVSGLGISRLEQDILPSINFIDFNIKDNISQSFYFPFGYITTGRVCLTALLQKKASKLAIKGKCTKPCINRLLELKKESFLFSVFQKGPAVFYLYPASLLKTFIEKAKNKNIRMVYQGDIF